MDGYASAKSGYNDTQSAQPERASDGLLGSASENSKRLAILADKLGAISTRLCGSVPAPVEKSEKVMPGGNGFHGRLAATNTQASMFLDECDRSIQRIEQFV